MKLRVVLGPAGSGKTRLCLEGVAAAERAGERGLLIVPDQFTYAADRLLFEETSLRGTRAVRILSFSRLAHMVCPRQAVTEVGRKMLLRRVVGESAPAVLGPLARAVGQAGLVDALAATIRELRAVAGPETAARLRQAAGDQPRLQALAAIVAAYDAHLERLGRIDPQDRHHLAAAQLAGDPIARGVPVWIDGFASFTPAEKGFVLAFLKTAAALTVSLCCDPADARSARRMATEHAAFGASELSDEFVAALRRALDRPVFLPTLRSALWLATVAPGSPAWIELPGKGETPPRFGRRPRLAAIERRLFGPAGGAVPPEESGGASREETGEVRIDRPAHPYEEVRRWARAIDRWVRLDDAGEPLRYRDLAVLIRDLEAYRPLIRAVFGRYGIPYFIDERRDVTAHPLVRLLLGVLELESTGWSRANVLGVLRNPLLGIAAETCDLLENLSLEYGIEYERWFTSSWDLWALPGAEREEGDDEGDEEPAEGATGRRRQERRRELGRRAARQETRGVFDALRAFRRGWRGGEPSFAEGEQLVRRCLTACLSTPETGSLATVAQAAGDTWTPEESAQVGRLLEETFAQGRDHLAGVAFSAQLFARVLRDALGGATVGVTPRHLDAVVVAEPRRARINEVRRVILGGVTAASYPRLPEPDPLLTDPEREHLTRENLPVMPVALTHLEEDPYLFYIACTRPLEVLWLTAPQSGLDGSPLEPSAYLEELRAALGAAPEASPPAERSLPAHGARAADTGADAPSGPGSRAETEALIERIGRCQHAAELPAVLRAAAAPMTPADRTRLRDQLPAGGGPGSAFDPLEQPSGAMPDRLAPGTCDLLYPRGELPTSASGLETFAGCPFQFFARQVLRLEPRPEAILKPRSTGSAVHEALRRFFATDPRRLGREAALGRIREIFGALREEDEYRIFQEDPASAYQWSRTGHHLELFVTTELRRLAGGAVEPVATELAFGLPGEPADLTRLAALLGRTPGHSLALPAWELAVPEAAVDRPRPLSPPESTLLAGAPPGDAPRDDHREPAPSWRVLLRGRIDRLDEVRLPDGSPAAVVIDYKSSIDQRKVLADLPRGLDLQVATYLLVARDLLGLTPGAGLYYSFKAKPRSAPETEDEPNPHAFKLHGLPRAEVIEAVDPGSAFGLPRGSKKTPGGLPAQELEARLEEARRQVAQLAAGILRGHIRPYPARKSAGKRLPCEYCDYRGMCRFVEGLHPVRGITGGEEGGPDE